jgi:hypothetical protein
MTTKQDSVEQGMKDMQAMAKEPLCEALAAVTEKDEKLGMMFTRHPLVHGVTLVPGMANRQLKQKREQLGRARDQGDFHTVVFLHERPYRVGAAAELFREADMTDEERGAITRSVWMDSENLWQAGMRDLMLLIAWGWNRQEGYIFLMDDEERKALAGIITDAEAGKPVTVYRGFKRLPDHPDPDHRAFGCSWTLDREKAEWFARRLLGEGEVPVVRSARLSEQMLPFVYAHFLGRGESEIVIHPNAPLPGEVDAEIDAEAKGA